MFKSYWKLALLALVSLGLASCEDETTQTPQKDSILFNGVTELVFSPEDTADKTISFNSTADWTLSVENGAWLSVSPQSGNAGENITLTVALNELESDVDRQAKVIISGGDALAAFTVKQTAVVYAESIALQGNHRIVLGYDTQLEVAVTPAGGRLQGEVAWESSDDAVATVADGVVTAVALGQATITATVGEMQAEFLVEVTETFITDGVSRTYTLADLAAIEYSGVTGEAGEYVIGQSFELAESDVLALGDANRIVVNDAVRLTVAGMIDFAASSEVEFTAAAEAIPDPIYFTGDVQGAGTFKNIHFNGMALRYFGAEAMTIQDCRFTGIVDSEPAINLGGTGLVTVSNCEFVENAYPAIAAGANTQTPLIFQDNYLYKNSADARNRPQINVTVPGDGVCQILRNVVIGPGEITKNGGIAVSNLLGLPGANKVEIIGNEVSDCRYGITLQGAMDGVLKDNILMNNCWEENAMNGGSGVSLYDTAGGLVVYMSGNHIEGSLWGITNIGYVANGVGPVLNLGNLTEGDDYNPGGNVFINNGNGGVLYDLYNNSPIDVMAQGNTWNVDVQDEDSIEEVIFHKNDNSTLGQVTFMPAAEQDEE